MREIKFRAKGTNSDEWVYGNLISMDIDGTQSFILPFYNGSSTMSCRELIYSRMEPIKFETIGQFTGLFDKSGIEIYEGDVVNIIAHNYKYINLVVGFKLGSFTVEKDGTIYFMNGFDNFEVIGNIHDEKELL